MTRSVRRPRQTAGLFRTLISIALHGFFFFIAALGLKTLSTGLMWLWSGHPRFVAALGAVIVGIVFIASSLGFLYYTHVTLRRRNTHLATIGNRFPNQPWMQRPDWAARKVVHSTTWPVILLWLETMIWWTILAFVYSANLDKFIQSLSSSWTGAIFGILFVLGGLLLLLAAIRATLTWLRFGHAVLSIDTLPGIIGGKFRGKVQAHMPKLHDPLEIKLVCEAVSRISTTHKKRTDARFEHRIFGETVSKFDARRITMRNGKGVIPIDIAVPIGGRDSGADSWGNGVRWMLSISTTGDKDPRYVFKFEVPIYRR